MRLDKVPNRILKESTLTSPNLNRCSIPAQDLYKRLLCLVDDYGCCEANVEIIKGRAYSMVKGVSIKSIAKWRDELVKNRLIRIWENEERQYLVFTSAEKNLFSKTSYTNNGNPTRHRRKTPEPPLEMPKSAKPCQKKPELASLSQPSPNPNPNPNNIYMPLIGDIIAYLNEKSGKNFKDSLIKNQTLIRSRIKEGFTIDDFKKVIDIKVREWAKNPEMEGYLRPHTLFGNKFESYLNQKAAQEHGGITYEKYNKKKQ